MILLPSWDPQRPFDTSKLVPQLIYRLEYRKFIAGNNKDKKTNQHVTPSIIIITTSLMLNY